MTEVYQRRIKGITGNGTSSVKLDVSPNKRLHSVELTIVFGVAVTLATQATAISAIRVKVGTKTRRELSGTKLRDYMLLNGTIHDWNVGPASSTAQLTIPFAEDWFIANVADSLAWNPAILGGPIRIEIDSTGQTLTVDALECISDDLDAPSSGIISWEVIAPVSGGNAFYVEKEIEQRGRLIQASIYPAGGSVAVTAATVYGGNDDAIVFEARDEENANRLERAGLTPTASGRSVATIYDIVPVRGDALNHSWNLQRKTKMKLEGTSFAGTCEILMARLEPF